MPDQPDQFEGRPAIIVVAKPPIPGRVKTRLIGHLSPRQAAAVHAAMQRCIMERVAEWISGSGDLVLALDTTISGSNRPAVTHPPGWRRIDQGGGDLGERLAFIWQRIGGGPAVFLGTDSPDVPMGALKSILPALGRADAVIGPVRDGGYWVLAARAARSQLLSGIDWGTDRVYHQTHEAARRAGIGLVDIDSWFDIDTPDDLQALRRRLRRPADGSDDGARDPRLVRLAAELDQACLDQACMEDPQ